MTSPVSRTPDIFLGPADAARAIGISVRTLRRYIRSGALVVDGYIGRSPRIRYTRLERFVVECHGSSSAATYRQPNEKSVQTAKAS